MNKQKDTKPDLGPDPQDRLEALVILLDSAKHRASNTAWKVKMFCKLGAWSQESREYWRKEIWARDPDERYCCNGDLCGCRGATVRWIFDTHGEAI